MHRKNKKLKYKDVVNKDIPKSFTNNTSKFRKSFNKNKPKGVKRKFDLKRNSENKKPKVEEFETKRIVKPEKIVETESESENEIIDHMKELRETLGVSTKKYSAIESSDESSEDETEDINAENALDDSNLFDNEELVSENRDDIVDNSDNDSLSETEDLIEDKNDIEPAKTETDSISDNFFKHLSYDIHESLLKSLQTAPILYNNYTENWLSLGNLLIQIPKSELTDNDNKKNVSLLEKEMYAPLGTVPKRLDYKKCHPSEVDIKIQLQKNLNHNNKFSSVDNCFSPLQAELFSIINNYQDLLYPEQTFNNVEEIRFVYCLHAINHMLKTRARVLHHNAKLSKKDDTPEEFRDQGLVRPKVLMIVPFKDSAYKIINMFIKLVESDEKGTIMNRNRFQEDYTGNEIVMPKKNPKPEDYEQTFSGNSSDDFKIGVTITKKGLKLYADFYSADIIIASPLGLRTIIGAEGDPERDYDFLASIELLILDQTEIFLMQNWDHLLHVFNHLHLQPKDSHGTDFTRVRTWSLNGWSKYYRQTLIFSSFVLPEINAIFNKKCLNYCGKVKVVNNKSFGTIGQVVVQLPHVYQRFEASSSVQAIDERFDFFISKILPQKRDSLMKQTMIFVANYFDYVRLRNYFKREDISFTQICEYSKDAKIARARDMFFHGDSHFLLFTERYHFFNRIKIKGIRHLVFYQLPNFPHFYYEICNLMQEINMNKKVGNVSNMSVTVLYSKYDVHQLAAVVGTERASKMVQSDRDVHMMITGAN